MISADVADIELIQRHIGPVVQAVGESNQRLWTCLLDKREGVHGAYFAISFSKHGKLHVHALVHGSAPLGAICDFWRSEGFKPDETVEEVHDHDKVASYFQRANIEWPKKKKGRAFQHWRHPHPAAVALIIRARFEHWAIHRTGLRFSQPFGTLHARTDLEKIKGALNHAPISGVNQDVQTIEEQIEKMFSDGSSHT